MTASVNCCHPIALWEAASPARTVRTALSRSTPCSAHFLKSGEPLILIPNSLSISLKMFFNEGGAGTPSGTEKDKPIACPYPWYGSCPKITTFTLSTGVSSNALNISLPGGKMTFPSAFSRWRRSASEVKYGFSNSACRAFFQLSSIWTFITW